MFRVGNLSKKSVGRRVSNIHKSIQSNISRDKVGFIAQIIIIWTRRMRRISRFSYQPRGVIVSKIQASATHHHYAPLLPRCFARANKNGFVIQLILTAAPLMVHKSMSWPLPQINQQLAK
jgi:hypothetical protein